MWHVISNFEGYELVTLLVPPELFRQGTIGLRQENILFLPAPDATRRRKSVELDKAVNKEVIETLYEKDQKQFMAEKSILGDEVCSEKFHGNSNVPAGGRARGTSNSPGETVGRRASHRF
jgi:hypothetical protein